MKERERDESFVHSITHSQLTGNIFVSYSSSVQLGCIEIWKYTVQLHVYLNDDRHVGVDAVFPCHTPLHV